MTEVSIIKTKADIHHVDNKRPNTENYDADSDNIWLATIKILLQGKKKKHCKIG